MRAQRFVGTLTVALTIILLSLTWAPRAWAAEYKAIYKFGTNNGDGRYPIGNLILDSAGNLYGTTEQGGRYGGGTVFRLTPKPRGGWKESVLYQFGSFWPDGAYPWAGLIFDAAGNLYGTTSLGGAYSYGTAFKLTPNPDGSWTENIIYHFSGRDGAFPWAGPLIFDPFGNLYGMTIGGGQGDGGGTIYQLVPNPDGSWTERLLHSFGSWDGDGSTPRSGLIFDDGGNLYGTTNFGGTYGNGTAFRLVPNPDGSWTEQLIWSFNSEPYSDLIFDGDGNLYGTTIQGGAYHLGTVFKLTHNPDGTWSKKTLHSFRGPDGRAPWAGLIFDNTGNLYGTTVAGGPYDAGTIFRLSPLPDNHWKLNRLHVFRRGLFPQARLTMHAAGNLYGTTRLGGLSCYEGEDSCGVVFEITP
jgi:uncharacterized repeat protein (TIGR03803 family)